VREIVVRVERFRTLDLRIPSVCKPRTTPPSVHIASGRTGDKRTPMRAATGGLAHALRIASPDRYWTSGLDQTPTPSRTSVRGAPDRIQTWAYPLGIPFDSDRGSRRRPLGRGRMIQSQLPESGLASRVLSVRRASVNRRIGVSAS
jgi:hypothetical protein